MACDALAIGLDQIMRQDQQPGRAQRFRFLRVGDGLPRAIAGAGDDRHLAPAGVDGGLMTAANSSGVSEKNSPVPPAANSALAP